MREINYGISDNIKHATASIINGRAQIKTTVARERDVRRDRCCAMATLPFDVVGNKEQLRAATAAIEFTV